MALPRMSPEANQVLAAAAATSQELGNGFLGVEHLFLGLGREERPLLEELFQAQPLGLQGYLDRLQEDVRSVHDLPAGEDLVMTPRCCAVLGLAGRLAARQRRVVAPADLLEAILLEGRGVPVRLLERLGADLPGMQAALRREPAGTREPATLLEKYGRDLTALAAAGQLSPVIGREAEMDLLAQVLLRRSKNNPVVVGEAGVGKTAVVEGFAQRLASPDCPKPLQGSRIVELAMGSLVAGTKYRGEFEERLLGIVEEVRKHPEVILFLDEIHTLVGAGASGGGESLDAANILKPALARGELRCIGATTTGEFRRFFEGDPALERRFEQILVEEPSREETLELLARIRDTLEEHHGVDIEPAALEAAVDLTSRHVPDRRLPDKAIDAVDQSCARIRLRRATGAAVGGGAVTAAEIASTVSRWTGIPLERLSGDAARNLLNLEAELRSRVLGQDHAVREVARVVLTAKAGLARPGRPLGVFLFLGPTGVGKTWLARSLAEVLFGDGKRLVRLDMSEYKEPHSVAKLLGAPPGYVGHEQEGVLIAALRTHPHCVLLLDEVEKAHPEVFDLFLQVFDEGRLTGARGRSADFSQAIIIMTSNLGTTATPPAAPIGFRSDEDQDAPPPLPDALDVVLEHFRPELVNRMDAVVRFQGLSQEALRGIVDRILAEIEELGRDRKLRLSLDEEVYAWIMGQAEIERFGARELHRIVDRSIRQPLARELLRLGERVGEIRISLGEGGLRLHARSDEEMTA